MSQTDDYLSIEQFLELQKIETREIIESLKADGSESDALYTIEHHIMAEDFKSLESAVVEAFKMGFEVLEAEEITDEDGTHIFCCDAIMDTALDVNAIDEQVEKLVHLAEKYDIIYDGWGTYYEGEDAEYDVIEEGADEE